MQIILDHYLKRHGEEHGLALHVHVYEVPPDFRVLLQENDVKQVGNQLFPFQDSVETFLDVHDPLPLVILYPWSVSDRTVTWNRTMQSTPAATRKPTG